MSRLYRPGGEYEANRRPIDEILADGIDDLTRTTNTTAIVLTDRFDASLSRMVGNSAQLAEMYGEMTWRVVGLERGYQVMIESLVDLDAKLRLVNTSLNEILRVQSEISHTLQNPAATAAAERRRTGLMAMESGWFAEAVVELEASLSHYRFQPDVLFALGIIFRDLAVELDLTRAYQAFMLSGKYFARGIATSSDSDYKLTREAYESTRDSYLQAAGTAVQMGDVNAEWNALQQTQNAFDIFEGKKSKNCHPSTKERDAKMARRFGKDTDMEIALALASYYAATGDVENMKINLYHGLKFGRADRLAIVLANQRFTRFPREMEQVFRQLVEHERFSLLINDRNFSALVLAERFPYLPFDRVEKEVIEERRAALTQLLTSEQYVDYVQAKKSRVQYFGFNYQQAKNRESRASKGIEWDSRELSAGELSEIANIVGDEVRYHGRVGDWLRESMTPYLDPQRKSRDEESVRGSILKLNGEKILESLFWDGYGFITDLYYRTFNYLLPRLIIAAKEVRWDNSDTLSHLNPRANGTFADGLDDLFRIATNALNIGRPYITGPIHSVLRAGVKIPVVYRLENSYRNISGDQTHISQEIWRYDTLPADQLSKALAHGYFHPISPIHSLDMTHPQHPTSDRDRAQSLEYFSGILWSKNVTDYYTAEHEMMEAMFAPYARYMAETRLLTGDEDPLITFRLLGDDLRTLSLYMGEIIRQMHTWSA